MRDARRELFGQAAEAHALEARQRQAQMLDGRLCRGQRGLRLEHETLESVDIVREFYQVARMQLYADRVIGACR